MGGSARGRGCFLPLGLALVLIVGCGDGGGAREETRFVGAIAGPTEAGRIEIVFAAGVADLGEQYDLAGVGPSDPVAMSGRLVFPGGRSVNLTGSYDRTAQLTYLQGPEYVVAVYAEQDLDPTGPVLEGYYSGPDGQGRLVAHTGDAASIQVLCGSFTGSATGRWAMVLAGSTTALAVPADRAERSYFLVGSLSGDSAHYMEDDSYEAGVSASATFSSDRRAATGTWAGDGLSGDWNASTSGCQESPA